MAEEEGEKNYLPDAAFILSNNYPVSSKEAAKVTLAKRAGISEDQVINNSREYGFTESITNEDIRKIYDSIEIDEAETAYLTMPEETEPIIAVYEFQEPEELLDEANEIIMSNHLIDNEEILNDLEELLAPRAEEFELREDLL